MDWRKTLIFVFGMFNFIGCASTIECAKGVAGLSTKCIEDNRQNALVKTFNFDYATCYTKVKNILLAKGSYIYTDNPKKHMIAIYVSGEDTTPVGIFFKSVDASNTQVEVASPSTYDKELIARRVFTQLNKLLHPELEKGKTDAQE